MSAIRHLWQIEVLHPLLLFLSVTVSDTHGPWHVPVC